MDLKLGLISKLGIHSGNIEIDMETSFNSDNNHEDASFYEKTRLLSRCALYEMQRYLQELDFLTLVQVLWHYIQLHPFIDPGHLILPVVAKIPSRLAAMHLD